jgi:hypothetical protein
MPMRALLPGSASQIVKYALIACLALLAGCAMFGQQPDETGVVINSGAEEAARKAHKKTVTFTRFQVAHSIHVEDVPDIWDGYPLELLRRLEGLGHVVAHHSTVSPYPDARNINPDSPTSRELIRRIAEQNDSQYVVSGIILDAAVSDESIRPYYGWQGGETGRRFELGLPWNSVVAGIRPVATERHLEVEIFLYDGASGTLIRRHRDHAEISGRVAVGKNKAFASAAFFETPFGQGVESLLKLQVGRLDQALAQVKDRASSAAR